MAQGCAEYLGFAILIYPGHGLSACVFVTIDACGQHRRAVQNLFDKIELALCRFPDLGHIFGNLMLYLPLGDSDGNVTPVAMAMNT